MIRLNVFIQVKEENRTDLLTVIKELVAASIQESGCIAYDIFESATRKDVLMICETWTNEEALAIHEKAEHFTTLIPKMQRLSQVKIEKFEF